MRGSPFDMLNMNDPACDTEETAMGRLLTPTFTLFACALALLLCVVLNELAGFMTA